MKMATRKSFGIGPEELGLTLKDGKTILRQVQGQIIQDQVNVESVIWGLCTHCHRVLRIKDRRMRRLWTVFGIVDIVCRRVIRCTCRGGKPWVLWPLGRMGLKRSTPELAFLLAKWGSKVPYRRAAELLSEFLPLSDRSLSHSTLRRHTLAVGAHLDQRVTDPEEYDWPDSQRQPVAASARMTVSIDGTYVRADSSGWSRQHYVVAGRIERDGQLGDRFAWIARRSTDPVDFMKATLENNGWTSASRVAVLADGADGLTNLVGRHINPRRRRPGLVPSACDSDPLSK